MVRGLHIIGSSIAAFHIARFFIDREYKVTQQGIQSEKFADKIYLVRDKKNYTYQTTDKEISVDASNIVYIGEEITDDFESEFTRLKNAVNNFKDKKFIFVSSDLVYGESKQEFREDSPLNPNSPKGEFYKEMESYIRNNHENYIILRCAELFGEGIYGKIYEMNNNCIEGKDFKVNDNKRDFLYIYNLCEVILKFIQKKINKETFNVANGQPVRYVAVGNLISSLLGEIKRKPNQVVIPICNVGIDESITDMENIVVDITKIKKKIRYDPTWNNITTILMKRLLPFQISNLSEIPSEKKIELLNRI